MSRFRSVDDAIAPETTTRSPAVQRALVVDSIGSSPATRQHLSAACGRIELADLPDGGNRDHARAASASWQGSNVAHAARAVVVISVALGARCMLTSQLTERLAFSQCCSTLSSA
jgi:hypothetical protein